MSQHVSPSELLVKLDKYYVSSWGDPDRSVMFSKPGVDIGIRKWNASKNREGVDLYATAGACLFADRPNFDHRVEFVLGLTPGQDDVAVSLASLGSYYFDIGEFVDDGHTVASSEPLWPGTAMNCWLVLRQAREIIRPLDLGEGIHIEFLQAIPIFASERTFKMAYGVTELLALWESRMIPFWSSSRSASPAE